MNFVITLSKESVDPLSHHLVDPQLLLSITNVMMKIQINNRTDLLIS